MAAIVSEFASDSHFQHTHTMINRSSKQLSPTEKRYLQIARLREVSASPVTQDIPHNFDTPASNSSRTPFHEASGDFYKNNKSVSPTTKIQTSRSRHRFMSQENILRSYTPYNPSSQDSTQNDQLKPSSCLSCHSNQSDSSQYQTPEEDGVEKKFNEEIVKVRDLAHIQSFAFSGPTSLRKLVGSYQIESNCNSIYEISEMPITDIIEMVAGLLTKIVTTNDRQHATRIRLSSNDNPTIISDHSSSVSAFHGKNVPNITIMSYLNRIHKYCPTTYEVFLSLLVYFDRMTERVNKLQSQATEIDSSNIERSQSSVCALQGSDLTKNSSVSSSDGNVINHGPEDSQDFNNITSIEKPNNDPPLSRLFVVDSYNIHRLVIAGVTCASKFFSDVFYTNSRYAKV